MLRMVVRRWFLFSFGIVFLSALSATANVTVTVHADQPGHPISPLLYGAFFEDADTAGDGGLYAELIQNRSFEYSRGDSLYAWDKIERDGSGEIAIAAAEPLNDRNPHYLRVTVTQAGRGVGVANSGFGGIDITGRRCYRFSLYARAGQEYAGGLDVRLESAEGQVYGACHIAGLTTQWAQYSGEFIPKASDRQARLVVLADRSGTVDLDMISLFPADTWRGHPNGLRPDLAAMIAGLHPAFLRFPGGCVVEGKNLANAYRWKETLGDVAARRNDFNRWIDFTGNPHYYQTNGLGFYEYFLLCEDLGAEPVPVINCGMSCQFEDHETVSLDQLGPYIQDALDLIEYANGPADSVWGAKRAAAGHPAPFHLKYLGIGNEQWGNDYFDRYALFARAIRQKYPEIQLISTSGPYADGPLFDLAQQRVKTLPVDLVDEHYYRSTWWFLRQAQRYDGYDRAGAKIFVGEYGAIPGNWHSQNTIEAALAEAALLTGVERNSDVVAMTSGAPLLAKLGASDCTFSLIWFDNHGLFATPAYYMQQMLSENRGDRYLSTEVRQTPAVLPPAGGIGLSTYHTEAEFTDIHVTKGAETLLAVDSRNYGQGWTPLHGDWQCNTGVFHQRDPNAVTLDIAGDPRWSDYTVTLKARRLSGSEGCIVAFRRDASDGELAWNLGGWNNSAHALQSIDGDDVRTITSTPGTLDTGRWYDVHIVLHGARVQCYLDGKLVHDVEVAQPGMSPQVYATASRDERSGELILKLVNPSFAATPVGIRLAGMETPSNIARVIILGGTTPFAHNSMEQPRAVAPEESVLRDIKPEFTYTLKPWSLTVIRIATHIK